MAARALNEQEKVLHQAALAKTTRVISIDEVKALVPDEQTRILALNFLLSAGLFRASCDDKGAVVAFRALEQDELESVKDLTIDEISCLHYIRVAGDQGMSSRKLRTSTGLHKAAMEKSVKTLVNRKLIKVIKGSLHNTRQRTFILYDLEPGVEITGGSWYTDKKIDVEFIDQVKSFCLRYIVDRVCYTPSSCHLVRHADAFADLVNM
ncbi:hypothetical protein CC1G_06318 [Coprinopsis cinerea okayama7|uniref:DNA-directed RNA polymerase III subunit RPC6 n=1 Tax=Coprinopsis cinerea (strain Okayama-7 / 130 / ATCC MYA-4618 / FGSC 9003) TaxID=240176 RepID=A8NTH8_COPC7|nr:hypothetical protein CC1G_06318 [Coprinopsis cinerea okayama7\|eukprot:XP_001836233.2 hypothetical protein CC1G_06318 [Coprinopsis cinerea okayama7\